MVHSVRASALILSLFIAACVTAPPAPTVPPLPPAPSSETSPAPIPDEARQNVATVEEDTSDADRHCLLGCPRSAGRANQVIHRHLYTLSNNRETKLADWVAYVVTSDMVGEGQRRDWQVDPDLDATDTLEEGDYEGARAALGVDRGHQAPLASFTGSEYWPETNYLSNVTPQNSNLNQGRWARLEDAERDLAETEDSPVYVVTGPLYEHTMARLPNADEPHRVPSGYWKVIALPDGRATGFVFENRRVRGRYCAFVRPIAEIEQRSGLDLFPETSPSELTSLAPAIGC